MPNSEYIDYALEVDAFCNNIDMLLDMGCEDAGTLNIHVDNFLGKIAEYNIVLGGEYVQPLVEHVGKNMLKKTTHYSVAIRLMHGCSCGYGVIADELRELSGAGDLEKAAMLETAADKADILSKVMDDVHQ